MKLKALVLLSSSSGKLRVGLNLSSGQTDTETNRETHTDTERQTDRQTDMVL